MGPRGKACSTERWVNSRSGSPGNSPRCCGALIAKAVLISQREVREWVDPRM